MPFIYLFIYSFIHYATEAAHITLQTYKIKHKVKTQSIKNSKNTTQQRNQIQIWTVWANTFHSAFLMIFSETEDTSILYLCIEHHV